MCNTMASAFSLTFPQFIKGTGINTVYIAIVSYCHSTTCALQVLLYCIWYEFTQAWLFHCTETKTYASSTYIHTYVHCTFMYIPLSVLAVA